MPSSKSPIDRIANSSSENHSLLRRLPLQVVLIVPFVLQIGAAVGLTGYLSLRNGEKAVDNLAMQLATEIDHRIHQNLVAYLRKPYRVNNLNASALKLKQINLRQLPELERHFWEQMQTFDEVSQISMGNEAREFVGVEREEDGSLNAHEANLSTNYTFFSYALGQQGERQRVVATRKNYDPRLRPWYKAAIDKRQAVWSEIFPHFVQPTLIMGASQPMYDVQGKLEGVLLVTLQLSKIGNFLRSVEIGEKGQAFLIERDGHLVATSTTEQPFRRVGDKTERLAAIDSRNTLTQATAQYLRSHFNSNLSQIEQTQQLDFRWNNQPQLVQISPFRYQGLDWLIVVVVPESEFMAQINANTQTTIALCLAALVVAIVIGICTARWIAHPILELQQASEAVAAGNLDRTVAVKGLNEIAALAKSFNQMAAQLKASFTSLERSNLELEDRVMERTQELSSKNAQLEALLAELHRTQAQMIQSEKMSALGQMVAGVAHEINNPVSFIRGNLPHINTYTQDLLSLVQTYQASVPNPPAAVQSKLEEIEIDFLTKDLVNLLQSMEVGSDRICEIVFSLRNFSRLDEAEFKTVDIHEGIDSTLLILQHRLKAQPYRPAIEVVKQYGQIPLVNCYPGQLNQVFMNILVNAIDALEERLQSQEKTIHSRIKIQTCTVNSEWVEISIADNGIGIPETIQPRIFDPFFTTKPIGKGTGMGMSISYQIIVERHHGKLEYFSTPGQGTEFILRIPVHQHDRES